MLPALLLTLLTTATADPDANPIAKPKPRPRKLHNDFFFRILRSFQSTGKSLSEAILAATNPQYALNS